MRAPALFAGRVAHGIMVVVVANDRCHVDTAFVDRDLLGNTMTTNGLSQEVQRRLTIPSSHQQEIHRGAGSVDCAIQILPGALGSLWSFRGSYPLPHRRVQTADNIHRCCTVR